MLQAGCAGGYVQSRAISDDGVVAGYYVCGSSGAQVPILWNGADVSNVRLPPGQEGQAIDVNSRGQCVGWMYAVGASSVQVPFIASEGVTVVLPLLPGDLGGEANAINDAGVAVGFTSWSDVRSVRWIDGTVEALELPIGPHDVAMGINAVGQICGYMGSGDTFDAHAYLWDNGNVTDLGKLPGGLSGIATCLNNVGDIAGYGVFVGENGVKYRRGLHWAGGAMTVIEPLPGYLNCKVQDINDSGAMVGSCDKRSSLSESVGFIREDGVTRDLNELLVPGTNVVITLAYGINASGQIAADGRHVGALDHFAVLLTPIPPILGDLDCDWSVDAADLAILLGAWGACPARSGPCAADLDGDGSVGGSDLAILLGAWDS
ncbi:MAG: hypothetical protein U0572_18240 [Phycisphaerales bacterium]